VVRHHWHPFWRLVGKWQYCGVDQRKTISKTIRWTMTTRIIMTTTTTKTTSKTECVHPCDSFLSHAQYLRHRQSNPKADQ
jgi:hypothetical protein